MIIIMKYPSIKDPQFQIKIKKIFNEYQIKKKKQTLKFKNEFLTSPKNKLNVRKQKGLNFKK